MALDLTSFDAALKQHYTNDMIENLVYKDNPLLALLPKMEDFGGRNLPIVQIWGNPQGRSADFTRAQTRGAVTNSKLDDFLLTRVKDYSLATIDNETLEASKGNANAFLEAATVEIDGAINSLTRSLATSIYRSGFGELGQIKAGSAVSGTTITLADANDVVNFEVGMELVVSDTVGASATRALGSSTNGLIITAIDRLATSAQLTFAYAVNDATNGIPAIAASDYLFVRGDRDSAASPVAKKAAGLAAWVPATAPSSTLFFGVDRTKDVTRLGGLRYDASALPIEEALIQGASLVAREGGKIDHFFMSYNQYSNLEKALGTKIQYIDLKVSPEVGFRGVLVNGPRGPIKCIPDQNCPNTYVYGLSLPMWKLYSLGKAVRVIDTDGLQMLRQSNADGVEVRYGFYGNMGCKAVGHNISLKVS
jgi:hypothetical protein